MTGHEAPRADLRAAAIEGLRWSAIARPVIEVVMLGSMVVLARLISPAEFGRFAVTLIVSEFAAMLAGEGIGTALVQRTAVTREHLQAGFAMALIAGLLLIALALIIASVIVGPIYGARTAEFVRLTSLGFIAPAAMTVPAAILRRRLAFRLLSVLDLVGTLVRAVACIAFALAGMHGKALIFGGLVSAVAVTVLAWRSAPPPPPRLRLKPAREILSYGLPASLAAASWVGFRNCDYAIVGARLGPTAAGLYYRAYQLGVEYQKKLSVVVSAVGFPLLARTPEAERADLQGRIARLMAIMIFPLLSLLAIVAPVLVPRLFGPQWTAAVLPTQILAAGGAATVIIDTCGAALMAAGRPRALLGFGVGHFTTYALAVFLVVPLGLSAVAIAAAVVHGGFLVVAYTTMLRQSPAYSVRRIWSDLAPATMSCLALAVVGIPAATALSATHAPALVQLAGVTLIAAPAYLLTLRIGFTSAWRDVRAMVDSVIPTDKLRRRLRRLRPAGTQPAVP